MCKAAGTSQVLEAWLCHPGCEALLTNGLIQGIGAFWACLHHPRAWGLPHSDSIVVALCICYCTWVQASGLGSGLDRGLGLQLHFQSSRSSLAGGSKRPDGHTYRTLHFQSNRLSYFSLLSWRPRWSRLLTRSMSFISMSLGSVVFCRSSCRNKEQIDVVTSLQTLDRDDIIDQLIAWSGYVLLTKQSDQLF